MSVPMPASDEHRDDPVSLWGRAASGVRREMRRRRLTQAMFGLLAIPGLIELTLIWRWSLSQSSPSWLLGTAFAIHFGLVVVALGPAIRPSGAADTRSLLHRLTVRYAGRIERLRLLRYALFAETLLLGLVPVARALIGDGPLRWDAFFTLAVATLSVVWPLERIALAQRSESRRLAASDLR
ncbi:MAG: hypothetical protein HOP28_10640 [Gemmatimonadales bacterium]|nr:hypothetical protein [Gemmatimonadales bacterium]